MQDRTAERRKLVRRDTSHPLSAHLLAALCCLINRALRGLAGASAAGPKSGAPSSMLFLDVLSCS